MRFTRAVLLVGMAAVMHLVAACGVDEVVRGDPPELPPVAPSDTLAMRLYRLDGGSGSALVSSGVPMQPGQLLPAAVDSIRVTVGGVEQPIYVEALSGRFPDGTVRAVLVQFQATVGSTPLNATIDFGTVRTTSDREKLAVTWDMPQVVAVPSAQGYLVGTGLVGPTVTLNEAPSSPAVFQEYESQFVQFSDYHWNLSGEDWEQGNYYDRALNHYAYWVRGGDVKYWQRATALAVNYRRNYLENSGFAPSPHWAQLEGLAVHYWLTGDERSRTAVVRAAGFMADGFTVADMGRADYIYNEGRIQQRVLMGCLLSWLLADASRDWGALADGYVSGIIGLQSADGSYAWPNWEGYQSNYMVGLQNDALIKYHLWRQADSRIPGTVKRALDYLWTTQWVASAQAFQYVSGNTATGGTDPASDLNLLIGPSYGWYYKVSGDATYRTRGDAVFAGAVEDAYLQGSKQFNQQYYSSFNYLSWRAS